MPKSIRRPPQGWLSQPGRLAHSRGSRGHKLPGWEQVNVARLAELLEMNATHLRALLVGRKTGRIATYQRLCRELGLTWSALWNRIKLAQEADIARMSVTAARMSQRLEETRRLAQRFESIQRGDSAHGS